MKNRKRIIVAFLCAAMLVVGVAYANASGTLKITGAASFTGADDASSNVSQAIAFTGASTTVDGTDYADVATASFNGTAADLTVTFTDVAGTANTFTAKAQYTVSYGGGANDSVDASYPDAYVKVAKAEVTSDHSDHQNNWDIDVELSDNTLTPDGAITVTVTVTFNNVIPDPNDPSATIVHTGNGGADIAVHLDWSTDPAFLS